MSVTVGDDNPMRQRQRQPAGGEPGNGPQLARARDVDGTENLGVLPDTDSDRRVDSDLLDRIKDSAARVWSGEVWDEQPPSPRELVDRYRQGAWANSEAEVVQWAARAGCVFAVAWSVVFYTAAVAGQRFWRFFLTAAVVAALWFLGADIDTDLLKGLIK